MNAILVDSVLTVIQSFIYGTLNWINGHCTFSGSWSCGFTLWSSFGAWSSAGVSFLSHWELSLADTCSFSKPLGLLQFSLCRGLELREDDFSVCWRSCWALRKWHLHIHHIHTTYWLSSGWKSINCLIGSRCPRHTIVVFLLQIHTPNIFLNTFTPFFMPSPRFNSPDSRLRHPKSIQYFLVTIINTFELMPSQSNIQWPSHHDWVLNCLKHLIRISIALVITRLVLLLRQYRIQGLLVEVIIEVAGILAFKLIITFSNLLWPILVDFINWRMHNSWRYLPLMGGCGIPTALEKAILILKNTISTDEHIRNLSRMNNGFISSFHYAHDGIE